MGRRAHRNKSSSSSIPNNVSILSRPAPCIETKTVAAPAAAPVPEPPEEIFYMTENGIDLKAMYPDIQLFENAIKYGVGSWYDLGEKLTRIEKTAPRRNVRVIETT